MDEAKFHGVCIICGRPRLRGCTTCLNSFCQEACFYRNMARNTRSTKKRQEAEHKAAEAEARAVKWG